MSVRSDILDAIVTVFGGPTVVVRDSVQTNYDELKAMAGDTLTGVVTTDLEDVGKTSYGDYTITLPVTVERIKAYETGSAWLARQAERATEAESILEGLLATLGAADPTLGGLADYVDYAGGNIFLPDEATYIVGATIVLRVRYQFSISDPTE